MLRNYSKSIYKTLISILKYDSDAYKLTKDEEGNYNTQEILKVLRKIHVERKMITAFDLQHLARCHSTKLYISKDLRKIKLIEV